MSRKQILLLILLILGLVMIIVPSSLMAIADVREEQLAITVNIVLILLGAGVVLTAVLLWYFDKNVTFEPCDTSKYASCIYDPQTGKIISTVSLETLATRSPQKFARKVPLSELLATPTV